MPIISVLMFLSPLFVAVPMAINESGKEQKVNEICVQKFSTTEEIQECKTILMKIQK